MKKFWLVILLLLLAVGAGAFYFRFYFVFGEGVKSGELNYVVKKGVIFKTYEGKLIQSGIRSKAAGSIQSYEFEFSVESQRIAERLMLEFFPHIFHPKCFNLTSRFLDRFLRQSLLPVLLFKLCIRRKHNQKHYNSRYNPFHLLFL